jgi:HlyD family secretion protein
MKKKLPLIAILLILISFAVYKILPYLKPSDEGPLVLSGRVEATEIELNTRIPGRLKDVFIEDGMEIRKGQLIALIEDEELRAEYEVVKKGIEELSERILASESNIKYLTKRIEHTINEYRKELEIAGSRLKQAEIRMKKAERELKRYTGLLDKGLVSEEDLDDLRLNLELYREEKSGLSSKIERARISLKKAEDSREVIRTEKRRILSLRKSQQKMEERLRQTEIAIGYTKVYAPVDGIVLKRTAEPGEVLPQGGVVGVMIDPASIHVRTYLPERYLGRVHIDLEAEVVTDAYPEDPITGFICHISDRAEFTPKEVQSYEERVKQVFALKICFTGTDKNTSKKRPHTVLKKGMPVDVRLDVKTER